MKVGRTALENLQRDYRSAFLRYLPRREEAPLHSGYKLGRAAVAERISILDVARVHHDVFLEVLQDTPTDELTSLVTGASEFFLEVLATFDMAQRSLLDDG